MAPSVAIASDRAKVRRRRGPPGAAGDGGGRGEADPAQAAVGADARADQAHELADLVD